MKRIIKSKKISNVFFFILGAIIFGSIGAAATNYLLKAEDVEYKNNKNLQDAIDELYGMANSGSSNGNVEDLPVGTVTLEGFKVIIPYTGTYSTIYCVYGINDNYGNIGTINNNTCVFSGSSGATYNYKLMATDNNGKMYEYHSTVTMGSGRPLSVVNLGDYIYLKPKRESYLISNNATIYPNQLTVWRVFKKNDDGTIDVVSDQATNSVGISNYAVTPPLVFDEDEFTLSQRAIYCSGTDCASPTNGVCSSDLCLINEALGTLSASNGVTYCTGSNYTKCSAYTYDGDCRINNGYKYVISSSVQSSRWYTSYPTGTTPTEYPTYYCGFRPILTLKSNVKIIGGTGVSGDVYQLGL